MRSKAAARGARLHRENSSSTRLHACPCAHLHTPSNLCDTWRRGSRFFTRWACACCRRHTMAEAAQQQQDQSLEQQKAELIASLPMLLAGKSPESVDKAAIVLSRLPAAACAGYLRWSDADRRRAVLGLVQESAGRAASCCGATVSASYRPHTPQCCSACNTTSCGPSG